MSFITGSEAGKHWIIPGSFVSNNFDITYGLGELTINKSELIITAADKTKTYGEIDPDLTYSVDGELMGTDQLSGALSRELGDDAREYKIYRGSLRAGENYNITYVPATLTTDPATLLITATAKDTVYNGTQDAEVELSDNRLPGDTLEIIYLSSLFEDKNAGLKTVTVSEIQVQGADAGNYEANSSASTQAEIVPKDLVIEITADPKVYNGNDEAVTLANVRSGDVVGADVVSVFSENGTFNSINVGTWDVIADVSITAGNDLGNYSLVNTTATAQAEITIRVLNIEVSVADKTYDGTADVLSEQVSFTDDRISGDLFDINFTSASFIDPNAGTGPVNVLGISLSGGAAGNYSLVNSSAQTTASINARPANVILAEEIYYINEKESLPTFAFAYDGLIPGDSGNEGVDVSRNSDGASYSSSSNTSAGTYTVTPEPNNDNYLFTMQSAVLYVNPYGPGTRSVSPVLNCIEIIDLELGIYAANFEYKNENDEAVYIPVGENNMLTGNGIDWESSDEQPTLFEPGGGTFMVFFGGDDLSWDVSSRDNKKKVRNGANANSSSTKCGTNLKSASVALDIEEEPEMMFEDLKVYPNPVAEKVHIAFNGIENYTAIMLYDMVGNVYHIESIEKRSNLLEIDMAELSSGAYFIRIVMDDDSKVVTVIKQ